jgi:hypothetical protein
VSLEHVPRVDPLFCREPFQLHAEQGPGDGDAAPPAVVATQGATYAVKDYDGFVGLMLDRLRLTLPGWLERSPADIGEMLVELLAYAADYLSYQQDAAATEAYLRTAQKRRSLRRHARLLDYEVGEGCSARTFVQIGLEGDKAGARPVHLPVGTKLQTKKAPPVTFESLHALDVRAEHSEISLYDWGIEGYLVRAGATSAVLDGSYSGLRAGDVLMLLSSRDRSASVQAQPVRLVQDAALDQDPVGAATITRIAWSSDDALGFDLRAGGGPETSVVRGNVLLAEHHRTLHTDLVKPGDGPGRFVVPIYDKVQGQALTVASAEPYDHDTARTRSAASALVQDPGRVQPCVRVEEQRTTYNVAFQRPAGDRSPDQPGGGVAWTCRRSFLTSARFARDVLVDVDDDLRRIQLEFGDGTRTRALSPDAKLEVWFGVGGGPAGNVGACTLTVIEDPPPLVASLQLFPMNWLPAVGGAEREPSAHIKTRAPTASRDQERCVLLSDYVSAARQVPGVGDAAATFAWTGSRTAAVVHVLPQRSYTLDEALRSRVRAHLSARRLAGMDVEIRPPRYVPISLILRVGLVPGYDRSVVRKALEAALGAGTLADGRPGLFHPDGLRFGQPVYRGAILEQAAEVPGVAHVDVDLRRWDEDGSSDGRGISIGPTEVACLQGDLDRPGGGLVQVNIEGAQ